MTWFRKRRRAEPHVPLPDPEAMRAIQRAHDAGRQALSDQEAMHNITGELRRQRDENHFASLIYDSMKRKHP